MDGRLARVHTSTVADSSADFISPSVPERPASSPVPRQSHFEVVDSDVDHLSDDVLTAEVMAIVHLHAGGHSNGDEEAETAARAKLSVSASDSAVTGATTRPSASSTLSSISSKSLALPPLTNDQLNKSKFVLGSTTFFDSFFGLDELDRFFPDHKLRLSIVTWNMSSKPPDDYQFALQAMLMPRPANGHRWASGELQTLPELYVIGFQETPKSEAIVNHLKVGIQAVLGPNYALLQWSAIGVLHASVWIRRELLWSCTSVDTVPIHSRPTAANRIRTKGAVAMSFSLFGTSFLFINTHLSAHETNLRTRINQLDKVQQILNLKLANHNNVVRKEASSAPTNAVEQPADKGADANATTATEASGDFKEQQTKKTGEKLRKKMGQHSEYIFWFGDLNFRLELPLESVHLAIRQIATAANSEERLLHQHRLMRSDQLTNLMARGMIFDGFREAIWPPPFLPTYKCKLQSKVAIGNGHSSVPRSKTLLSNSNSESNSSSPTQSIMSSVSSITTNSSSRSVPMNLNTMGVASGQEESAPPANDEEVLEQFNQGRVPSFTDRVLYQSRQANGNSDLTDSAIRCVFYHAIRSIVSSDHKPVHAMFEVSLDSGGPRVPFRLRKLTQTADGHKSRVQLTRDDSLEQQSATEQPNGSTPNVTRNISFFGRKLGGKKRIKTKDAGRGGAVGHGHSISLSSLPTAASMARLDKLTRLNAGAFERQVFIDGLRLRNSFLTNCTTDDFKVKHRHNQHPFGLYKSRSFDSNLGEPQLPSSDGKQADGPPLKVPRRPERVSVAEIRHSTAQPTSSERVSQAKTAAPALEQAPNLVNGRGPENGNAAAVAANSKHDDLSKSSICSVA